MKEHANEPNTQRLYSPGSKCVKTRSLLTVEKLKSYPGLEKLSDAEAAEAVDAITRLAMLLFNLVGK